MDLLQAAYEDSSGEENEAIPSTVIKSKVNIAPEISIRSALSKHEIPITSQIHHNAEYDTLWAPAQGPSHPVLSRNSAAVGSNNNLSGFVEPHYVGNVTFQEQFHSFNNRGFAIDPSSGMYVTSLNGVSSNESEEDSNKKREKRKKRSFGDASNETFRGPWAPFEEEESLNRELKESALTDEQVQQLQEEAKSNRPAPTPVSSNAEGAEDSETPRNNREVVKAKSIFHGGVFKDYLGRTYIDPPSDLKPVDHECFLPKKLIHTWSGHTKGVAAIRFFPKYGHLLLSAGMDSQVKIWDVYNKQKCVRTFMGHSKAVRDICFTNDGRRFLSCSYDRTICLWDTETGDCLGSYSNGKIPYVVKFNPDPDKQHIFLAGCSDKRIVQWDTNSGKIVQQYDQHLGAVNTITFVDNNRRFVTSSDDKSIRVWEWGIPVVIKYISEPHMHSMPSISLHPSGLWFAAQSLDNQILVYSTKDKFRMNRKKVFTGHVTAGYACQVNFSPDGHWIMSGDSDGKLWFWDWNTNRVLKTLKCHDGVCIGAEWHPIETSKVATCGWDGKINYWD